MLSAAGSASAAGGMPPTDCTKHPALCTDLIQCDKKPVTDAEWSSWHFKVTTASGHANLRTFCVGQASQLAESIVQECLINHDLLKSAELVYGMQESIGFPEGDISYCFIENHCGNTDVTVDTTLAEAEEICDVRYPEWRNFGGYKINAVEWTLTGQTNPVTGFSRDSSRAFALAACAMGNYHCDVVHCKEYYCKLDEWRKKYGHYLPKSN